MPTSAPTRDKRGRYVFTTPASADQILEVAEQITAARFYREDVFSPPASAVAFLQSQLALRKAEVFAVAFLVNRHRVIALQEMFEGTIDGASARRPAQPHRPSSRGPVRRMQVTHS